MRKILILSWLLLCLLAFGCNGGDDDDATDDDTADDDDDDSVPADPPCADGSWGFITDGQDAIHVRADGDDGNDGSDAAPLATVGAALTLSREASQPRRIAIGPGTFAATLSVFGEEADESTDSGLSIEGCSPTETILEAENAEEPVIKVTESVGVRLAGLGLQGGRRSLWVWGGADVEIESVHVTNSGRLGIIIGGTDSIATMTNVEVHDPVVETDEYGTEYGYGISFQNSTATMTGGGVWGAYRVGILCHYADVTFVDVSVEDTAQDSDGYFGRGIQLQDLSMATISGGNLAGNSDAGVYSLRSLYLELDGLTVDATAASGVPDEAADTGDGIVISQGVTNNDPASYLAVLTDNTVTGSARAGILIDSVSAEINGNTAGADNGLSEGGSSIYAQGNFVMSGADSFVEPGEALQTNNADLETDDLVE